ncbi:FAD-dependent oxidoreductase [Pelagicoccus mobilis]|uniref:FAD-dependent oxidoreductase n=1 Tax=Pelagicoccus mobilis TaxID=415221 RepID=A0A934S4M6_9BACT|nr:FAD-dependent oxidoreductase [Pelagicoccus mobilis]MBK1879702.1 FAD-dependent oxidoreductase [Pelagicoccus mobilis]
MNLHRREFIGKLGMASAASILATHPLFGKKAKSTDNQSVLVETAHFSNTGGWSLDNQFETHLGFSYLLAHGMGKPVANASGEIRFPQAGKYKVWVLTKDWCQGEWDAPGQFKVLLGGKALKTTFGTEAGWAWQNGGTVNVSKSQLSSKVELQDLTGFDGRCSAIYFTLDQSEQPPIERKTLPAWRRKKAGLPEQAEEYGEYDVVIVGGGITGCAAALAADKQGLKTALIQNRPVLGGNASSEIRVHTLGIYGYCKDILSKIDTPHYPNGDAEAIPAQERREQNMAAAKNVEILTNHTMMSLQKKGNRIVSVDAVQSANGILRRFRAPQFIDCTGDGWLGAMSGAEFRYGRERADEHDEAWDEHGELWAPSKERDNRVMGTSLLWYTKETNKRVNFPSIPWAKAVAKNHISPKGEWQWEYSNNDLNQVDDAEEIRDHMLRAIYGTYSNTIKRRQYANLELDWVSYVGGKRESRRIIGDHIFSGSDARDSIEFPDTVVIESRSIDVHYQEKEIGREEDFLSEALFQRPKNGYYYIPYRSLYSKDVANLQMAGRCFSCTHIGLGGPRVMNTCGQMGVATGYAAYLAKKHGADPREIGKKHLVELRKLCGYPTDEPPALTPHQEKRARERALKKEAQRKTT